MAVGILVGQKVCFPTMRGGGGSGWAGPEATGWVQPTCPDLPLARIQTKSLFPAPSFKTSQPSMLRDLNTTASQRMVRRNPSLLMNSYHQCDDQIRFPGCFFIRDIGRGRPDNSTVWKCFEITLGFIGGEFTVFTKCENEKSQFEGLYVPKELSFFHGNTTAAN